MERSKEAPKHYGEYVKYRNQKITLHHCLYMPEIQKYQVYLTVGQVGYIGEFSGEPETVEIYNFSLFNMGKDYIYDFDWELGKDISMSASLSFLLKIITVIRMEFAWLLEEKMEFDNFEKRRIV